MSLHVIKPSSSDESSFSSTIENTCLSAKQHVEEEKLGETKKNKKKSRSVCFNESGNIEHDNTNDREKEDERDYEVSARWYTSDDLKSFQSEFLSLSREIMHSTDSISFHEMMERMFQACCKDQENNLSTKLNQKGNRSNPQKCVVQAHASTAAVAPGCGGSTTTITTTTTTTTMSEYALGLERMAVQSLRHDKAVRRRAHWQVVLQLQKAYCAQDNTGQSSVSSSSSAPRLQPPTMSLTREERTELMAAAAQKISQTSRLFATNLAIAHHLAAAAAACE